MKRYIFAVAALALTGCGDFLKEYSQSDIRPGSVADLQEMMMAEAYPSEYGTASTHFGRYLDVLTDDVQQADMSQFSGSTTGAGTEAERYTAKGMGPYTWSYDMYELMDEAGAATNTWEYLYSRIKGCNVALDNVDKVPGTIAERANLRGQALALRAFYHWYLVNCYGRPINEQGAAETAGVPIVVSSTVEDRMPARNTVGEVYARIEADLLEAAPLMEEHGQTVSKYRATYEFVCMMLARVYLYQEKWVEAAEWAGKIIERRPDLLNMEATGSANSCNVLEPASAEAIWLYSSSEEMGSTSWSVRGYVYQTSDELKNMYATGDMRKNYWFDAGYNARYVKKYSNTYPRGGGKGMRTAEAYLNRAEALIEQVLAGGDAGLLTQAMDDLNTLRQNRWRSADYVVEDITDPAQALAFYRQERRRELCWEEHRWFDLRRWGMPLITHQFQRYVQGNPQEYVLAEGDKRYVLPIPAETIEKNSSLTQNPR